MVDSFRKLLSHMAGASSAEYALILAIVGTGIAAAAFALGDNIAASFQVRANELTSCGGTC